VTDAQIIQLVRAVAVPIIFFLVIAVAVKQGSRVWRHWRYGEGSPEILIRDVVFFWGLSFLFMFSAVAGAFGIILATIPVWVVLSSTVAIGLLGIFFVYEYFVIGREEK
jgi:hypothetical protein